ncbi:MAG: hypothetical protein ACPL7B_02390 [Candidatus Poribacteria bacterium]
MNADITPMLVGLLVMISSLVSLFIAQKWFMPVQDEDLLEMDNGNGKNL